LGSCADIGCRVSVTCNKSMDSGCQSGFRRNHQKSRSAILQRFCGIPLAEKRDVVVKKNMAHLVRSSGVRCADVVGASRGAVRVIGNLLVSGRALRARSAIVSGMSRWACRALHSFVCRDLVVSMGVPIATLPLQEDARASLKEVFVVEAVRVWRRKGSRRGCNGDGGALASAGQLDYHR